MAAIRLKSLVKTILLTWRQFAGICRLTALEASRQPIFLLLSTIVLVFIGLLPVLITHVIGESSRIVRDSALALQLASGLLLGCFAATSTITRELRKGTLASIISKPVSRWVFFLAKFSGVALIMLVYATITTMATMLSVRTAAVTFAFDWWGMLPLLAAVGIAYLLSGLQNYVKKTPFVSRAYWLLTFAVFCAFVVSALVPAGPAPLGGEHGHTHAVVVIANSAIPWAILPAGVLIGLAMVLLSAFAVSLAVRFDMIPTFSICLGIFMLGLMSDYLFGRQSATNELLAAAYWIVPNWQNFWAVDALTKGSIPWVYIGLVAEYVAIYTAVVLATGLLAFYRMDVK